MTNTDITRQLRHVTLSEYIPHQAVRLRSRSPIGTPGDNACGVPGRDVHYRQRVIETLTHGLITNYAC